MSLFRKSAPPKPLFPPEEYEPVLRCSVCTGEQTACVRHRATGKLRELQLIRSGKDLEEFCRSYGVKPEELRRVY